MATEKLFLDVLQELRDGNKSGAFFVKVVESENELIKIYLKNGDIYHLRYGSTTNEDCVKRIETYTWQNATFFEEVFAPVAGTTKFPSEKFIAMLKKTQKKVRVP